MIETKKQTPEESTTPSKEEIEAAKKNIEASFKKFSCLRVVCKNMPKLLLEALEEIQKSVPEVDLKLNDFSLEHDPEAQNLCLAPGFAQINLYVEAITKELHTICELVDRLPDTSNTERMNFSLEKARSFLNAIFLSQIALIKSKAIYTKNEEFVAVYDINYGNHKND